jgi:hypothetical protein
MRGHAKVNATSFILSIEGANALKQPITRKIDITRYVKYN